MFWLSFVFSNLLVEYVFSALFGDCFLYCFYLGWIVRCAEMVFIHLIFNF